MASLSMKTYQFCGIFMLFFLEIKSEITPNATTPPLHSVQPPERKASPHTAPPAVVELNNINTSASYTHPVLALNSTDKTRTASEKLFTHSVSVSGTERLTHKETSAFATTASDHEGIIIAETKLVEKSSAEPKSDSSTSLKATVLTTSTNAPVLTSAPQPASNTSTVAARYMTTVLLKPDPKTTAFSTARKFTPTDSGRINTISAMTVSSTSLASEKSNELATTTSVKQTTPSTTTVKNNQSITNGEFIQSSATTTLPANATDGSVLVNHTESTENTRNFSTTTGSLIKNQSTTGSHIHTPTPTNISATTAEIPSTNGSIFMTTNATQGGLIPVVTKILPTSTPNPTVVTTQKTTVQPCSSFTMAKQCLIVIAVLAAVATIFIISTIVLCTKLSARKYKLMRQQQGTEMMCISSLLPERSNHQPVRYTRQRNPVPNGVLVIHNYEDSDDDIGDNLTLSSFLPENDRYV